MENIFIGRNKSSLAGSKSKQAVGLTSGTILKYLLEIASRLTGLKSGMEKNVQLWLSVPETPEVIERHIHETISLGMQIEKLKLELSEKYMQARKLRQDKIIFISKLEKRAIGIHAHQPAELTNYGIKHRSK